MALLVAAFFSVRQFAPGLLDKIVPAAKGREAVVPDEGRPAGPAGLPAANASNRERDHAGRPSPGCTDKPEVRFYHWAWNAQMGADVRHRRQAGHRAAA